MLFKAVVQERHGKLQKCFYKETAILEKKDKYIRRVVQVPVQRTITKSGKITTHSFKLPQRLFSLSKRLYS